MAQSRKLAAILAADVVGFSRLTGANEERTLARLRALRSDLFDPAIAVHHGRVVKRTGDGALVEFRSVVDAVRCAIEVTLGAKPSNAACWMDRGRWRARPYVQPMRRPRMETAPRGHETLKGWSAANGPHHQCFQLVMG